MQGKKGYIIAALAMLVLWAPLIDGGTTPAGLVIIRLLVLGLVVAALWRAAGGSRPGRSLFI